MTYPVLPMAIVTWLAAISEERAGLAAGATHVTVVAHHNEETRSSRFAITEPQHWGEMVNGAVELYGRGPTDTMTFLYPAATDGEGTGSDFGIILEGGRKPSFFEWIWSPKFSVRLLNPEAQAFISENGEGVKTLQMLLDRDAKSVKRPGGAANDKVKGSAFLGAGYGG